MGSCTFLIDEESFTWITNMVSCWKLATYNTCLLTSCNVWRCKVVLQFSIWLDKETLRCDNSFWSDLRSTVLVVKAFGNVVVTITGTCNKDRGCLQSVGLHELSCSIFLALQNAAYTRTLSLSRVMGLRRLPKKWEADSLDSKWKRRLQKPSMGTHLWRAGVRGRGERQWDALYISSLLKWVAMIMLVLWHRSLCDSFTGN